MTSERLQQLKHLSGRGWLGTLGEEELFTEIERLTREVINQAWRRGELEAENARLREQVGHRACLGTEHDPANGKIHGCCVICGEPWPCDYVDKSENARLREALNKLDEAICREDMSRGSEEYLRRIIRESNLQSTKDKP